MQNETHKARRSTLNRDYRLTHGLVPKLKRARETGARGLDDLHQAICQQLNEENLPGKKPSRSQLYRALLRLVELGLDSGLDDRPTARKRRELMRDKGEDKRVSETGSGISPQDSPPDL